MTGRIRIVKDTAEFWIQKIDDGFTLTAIDDMDRTITVPMSTVEAAAISAYIRDNISFREAEAADVPRLILEDAESEIRRIFSDRGEGWEDALSDVLGVVRDLFTDITDRGEAR